MGKPSEGSGTRFAEIKEGLELKAKKDVGIYYLTEDVKTAFFNISGILVYRGLMEIDLDIDKRKIPYLKKVKEDGGAIVLRSDTPDDENKLFTSARASFSLDGWSYSRATYRLNSEVDRGRSHEDIKSVNGGIFMEAYDHDAIMSAGPCPDGQLSFSSEEPRDLPRIYNVLNTFVGHLSIFADDLRKGRLVVPNHFEENIIKYIP